MSVSEISSHVISLLLFPTHIITVLYSLGSCACICPKCSSIMLALELLFRNSVGSISIIIALVLSALQFLLALLLRNSVEFELLVISLFFTNIHHC
jgi:hypothetical protein